MNSENRPEGRFFEKGLNFEDGFAIIDSVDNDFGGLTEEKYEQ